MHKKNRYYSFKCFSKKFSRGWCCSISPVLCSRVVPFRKMSSSPQKVEDTLFQSPINSEQAQNVYSSSNIDDTEISPESISVMARKESHRASERV